MSSHPASSCKKEIAAARAASAAAYAADSALALAAK